MSVHTGFMCFFMSFLMQFLAYGVLYNTTSSVIVSVVILGTQVLILSYLFKMFTESDPQTAFSVVEHLNSHEGVEDGCTDQGHTEVKPKEPPVLHFHIELEGTAESLFKQQGNNLLHHSTIISILCLFSFSSCRFL